MQGFFKKQDAPQATDFGKGVCQQAHNCQLIGAKTDEGVD